MLTALKHLFSSTTMRYTVWYKNSPSHLGGWNQGVFLNIHSKTKSTQLLDYHCSSCNDLDNLFLQDRFRPVERRSIWLLLCRCHKKDRILTNNIELWHLSQLCKSWFHTERLKNILCMWAILVWFTFQDLSPPTSCRYNCKKRLR